MSDLKQRIFDAGREFQLLNFATITEDGRPWVRYVVGKAYDDLTFRFCTHKQTKKIAEIRKNPNVHISLGAANIETATHWLQVVGTAAITNSKEERHSFWFEQLKNYFSGPDDPNYCIIIVKPSRIEYGTMGSMTPEVWESGG